MMGEKYRGEDASWTAPLLGYGEPNKTVYQPEHEKNYTPTFPGSEISPGDMYNGIEWGKCQVPLNFDMSATLPANRGGETHYAGPSSPAEIAVSGEIVPEFKHVVLYHELIEAEALSNGLSGDQSHPLACEMEERYVNTYLSPGEREAYVSLMGEPNSPESRDLSKQP